MTELPAAKRRRQSRRGRSQIHVFIADDVYQRLKAYTARRGLSACGVMEAALKQHLDQATDAALIMRRLDRIGRRVDKIRGDLELLTEFVSLWTRIWFAHTPQLPDSEKRTAQANAAKRYEQFLGYVTRRLSGTQRLAIELLGESPVPGDPEPGPPPAGGGDS
jgi:hypothetical protein